MHHLGTTSKFSVLLACTLAACSGSSDSGKADAGKGDAAKTDAAKTEPAKTEPAKTEPATTDAKTTAAEPADPAEPQPTDTAAPPTDPVVEPAAPGEVAITPIAPTAHTAAWRTIPSPSEAVELVVLNAGVLGKSAGGFHQIVDGQLATITFEEPPTSDVLGVWPDDAWFIESEIKKIDDEEKTMIRLMKLRDGKRWVPQAYAGEQKFVLEDHTFRKSTRAKGGMLVTQADVVERIAGNGDAPVIGSHRGRVVEYIETDSGKVYVISEDGDEIHVVIDCADDACVAEKGLKLPLTGWTFGRQATRDRHAASVLASAAGREFVLHARPQGWALGEFPAGSGKPEAMWSTDDGGLWIQAADELWHRDPDGTWRDVALPEGVAEISVAVTTDQKELWIAGTLGGAPAAFATHANAQEPAPASAPTEPAAP
jgi:hypothetical protein